MKTLPIRLSPILLALLFLTACGSHEIVQPDSRISTSEAQSEFYWQAQQLSFDLPEGFMILDEQANEIYKDQVKSTADTSSVDAQTLDAVANTERLIFYNEGGEEMLSVQRDLSDQLVTQKEMEETEESLPRMLAQGFSPDVKVRIEDSGIEGDDHRAFFYFKYKIQMGEEQLTGLMGVINTANSRYQANFLTPQPDRALEFFRSFSAVQTQ